MSSYELEMVLLEINKMIEKEKGLRGRVLLNNAYTSLKEYEKHLSLEGTDNGRAELNKEYKAKARKTVL